MESTNGPAPQAATKSLATEGRNRLRSSSKNVSKNASASLSSSPGTAGTLAGAMKERERSGSVDKEKKDKVKKEKKKKEKKEAASAAPSLLYFSTSTVPTVTHPELPSQLDKFLVTPGMDVVDGLVSRLRVEDMSDVCSDLSTIFEVHGQTRRLIQWAVRKELAATTNSSSVSTLFRQTGVATCMVSIECKRKGGEYLVALLRPFVQRMCSETKSMEVDPLRMRSQSAEDLESNRRRLVEASQDALDLIFASASSFPEALKHTFLIAHNEILQKLPNMRWTAISNFYFLRFVAPALVSPKASGVYDGNPSPQALRALMLISKTLSNAANGVPFGDKEGYMTIMNSVILDNQPRMRAFLEKLIGMTADVDAPDTQATLASFPLQSDLHMARCRLLAALYSHRNAVLPGLMNTPTPVPGWTPPARMSLSGNNAAVAFRVPTTDGERKSSSAETTAIGADDKSSKATLGEMLGQLLDAYRVHCPDWVSDEDKETKKKVQDELLERFEEGLAHTMRPVTPLSVPSGRLFRLLLDVEKQRTKELEEELRIIKLKLNTETQAKRDLQLQILRGNNAPASNGPSAGWVRERQRVAGQFGQMYDMLSAFRGRIVDLERLVLNEAATEGAPSGGGGQVPTINFASGQPEHPNAGGALSPRSRAKASKDKAKAQKRRSWNLKLGNPLAHNP